MEMLKGYIPKASIPLISEWISIANVELYLSKPRRTKLGDFRVRKESIEITINSDLNKYLFLITLAHEIAHALVWRNGISACVPHGHEWKSIYSNLLKDLLELNLFPKDITHFLKNYAENPTASLFSHTKLPKTLLMYDNQNITFLDSLKEGDIFKISSGRLFRKGKKIRKRIKCLDLQNNKAYLVHPLSKVELL